jgi:8-oxo-dGTP pyrophosphatase MutT (NUDIX family)
MESRVMSYIEQMRKLIGNRALLLVGTSVIVVQDEMILYGVFAGENRHFTYPNGHEVYVVDVVYICSDFTPSGVSPDDEVLEVRWFPFSDLPEQISPPVKDIIEGFIAEQG